jgi:hypothetical protein
MPMMPSATATLTQYRKKIIAIPQCWRRSGRSFRPALLGLASADPRSVDLRGAGSNAEGDIPALLCIKAWTGRKMPNPGRTYAPSLNTMSVDDRRVPRVWGALTWRCGKPPLTALDPPSSSDESATNRSYSVCG